MLCLGELLIDFICTDKGKSMIDSINFIKKPGGAPANVAVAINKMGAQSYFLGSVGKDPFGSFLRKTMEGYGVNCSMMSTLDYLSTTFAFVSLMENGERDFYFARGADIDYEVDLEWIAKEDVNLVHFGSATAFLGGKLLDSYYLLLNFSIKNNKIISFDPNYRPMLLGSKKNIFIENCLKFIKHSHILKVSSEEAEIITGTSNMENAAQMLNKFGAKFVMVTLGSEGALLSENGQIKLVKSKPVTMLDATGAGDAFIGCVLAQVANKYTSHSEICFDDLANFVSIANIAGAMTVQKYGALEAIPFWEDIINKEIKV